jgi:homoserine dehydrogenase
MSKTLRIGMIGGGTVGGGVYEIIMGRLLKAAATNQTKCVISKICVRDLKKSRDFVVDETQTSFTSDVNDILNDSSIDIVVEVMGGTGLAKKVVLESLAKGKSVVTANKALLAEHLDEINGAIKGESQLGFEAAVCGGIPIINTFQSCYSGDIIQEVSGIMNGTTNFMLCKMENGADYDDVLKEAQDLGYAEADPTADVEGHDVRAKIAILAKLAYGKTVPIDIIPCTGISSITSVDFEYAKILGCTIKLVGTAARLSKYGEYDGPLSVHVSPKVVPRTDLLGSAAGSGNVVTVKSSNLGMASYTGPGAGRFPTANSIVADIYRIANNMNPLAPFPVTSDLEIDNDYLSAFYIRISFQDALGIIRRVGELSEKHGVSINSVLQNPIIDRMAADFVVTTEKCKFSQVQALCEEIEKEDFARMKPLFMPLLVDY